MFKTPIGRLRLAGMIEAVSFLALLFIAMPMKYIGGDPSWVRACGMAHGLLFLIFCFVLLDLSSNGVLTRRQGAVAFVASLIPFGPFLIDRRLKALEAEAASIAAD
jgi:integral membrane protein